MRPRPSDKNAFPSTTDGFQTTTAEDAVDKYFEGRRVWIVSDARHTFPSGATSTSDMEWFGDWEVGGACRGANCSSLLQDGRGEFPPAKNITEAVEAFASRRPCDVRYMVELPTTGEGEK